MTLQPESISEVDGPVIQLNEALRPRFEKKLSEYECRMNRDLRATDGREFTPPEQRIDLIDTSMKIKVLQRLLQDGMVRTFDLSRELCGSPA